MTALLETYSDLVAKLKVSERDHLRYTECLIRQLEILLTNEPEEEVRQAFLYFIINNYPDILKSLVDIIIEHHDVDIAILKKPNDSNFNPTRTPLLLIEVKRNDVNLRDHQAQLTKYMTELRCSRGALFNFTEILIYEKTSITYELCKVFDHLDTFIRYISSAASEEDGDLEAFYMACNGNFDAFRHLTTKYKYSRATFVIQEYAASIEGFIFSYNGDEVFYDRVGHYAKKKHKFVSSHFIKLLSLID